MTILVKWCKNVIFFRKGEVFFFARLRVESEEGGVEDGRTGREGRTTLNLQHVPISSWRRSKLISAAHFAHQIFPDNPKIMSRGK